MVAELIKYVVQGGDALVKIVDYVEAGQKLIEFGNRPFNYIRGFIGPKQDENIRKLGSATKEKLAGIAADRLSEPSPSVLTPLLEAACQESRNELQDLWAALLSNAMIDGGRKVRREYIEVISNFEPIDALVLNRIAHLPFPGNWFDGNEANRRYIIAAQNDGIGPDEWLISCRALHKLGCIEPVKGTLVEPSLVQPNITPFGKKLLEACNASNAI